MHETMVAKSLFDLILAEAAKQNAAPTSAKISCGDLNPVNDEILSFAFDAIAKGTPCDGMKLEVEHKPIQGQCNNCGQVFNFEIHHPKCPKCSSDQFEILPDAPLMLEEIEFETE